MMMKNMMKIKLMMMVMIMLMICSFNLTFVVDFFQVVVIKNGSETGKLAVIQQKVDDVSNSSMMSMMM